MGILGKFRRLMGILGGAKGTWKKGEKGQNGGISAGEQGADNGLFE